MTAKKRLTLDDFIVPTLTDKPCKLFITLAGKETEEYLNVISATHSDLKRPIAQYGIDYNKLKKECSEITDDVDRLIAFSEGEEELNKQLALSMVTGWSLGKFSAELLDKLLTGNAEVANGIRAQSYTMADYIKKK